MPILILRGLTVFPGSRVNFELDDQLAISAFNAAISSRSKEILLLSEKIDDAGDLDSPTDIDSLYEVGTIAKVRQVLNSPEGTRALCAGESRGKLIQITKSSPAFIGKVEKLPEPEDDGSGMSAEEISELIAKTHALRDRYAGMMHNDNEEAVAPLKEISVPGKLSDLIAQDIFLPPDRKQTLLETFEPLERLKLLNQYLLDAIAFLEVDYQIRLTTVQHMENGQRERILREQLNVIRRSLGETLSDEGDNESESYREKILALNLPEEVQDKLLKECERLKKAHPASGDASVIANYLDACLGLPWNMSTEERIDAAGTRFILDADHYGLEKVKDRITEFVAVRQISPQTKGGILCLIGPPGTGKTSIAGGIAKALNRKMARISLGGIHDEADIRGHRKTYVGAMPGRIMEAVSRAGSKNALILLDEIDKLGHDYRGDPAAALLEALDPEQNATFRDHYLEIPFDLSGTLFITTANSRDGIPEPLLDRMEIIEIPSYTDEEKLIISKKYLLPKQRAKHGLQTRQIRVFDEAIRAIIADYTRESGVRTLERELASICRKAAVKIAGGSIKSVNVRTSNLEEILGPKKYKRDEESLNASVGLVHGLAWTSVGGEVLDVEVNVMDGTGKLELTGNLGDVMKESAKAAHSYIRAKSQELGIDPMFYKDKDIHIHFPEGATPKDGPSAGLAVTTAVVSALTGKPVRGDIAMTGEITLRGRALPIGGLREKSMGALRSGIRTVIIPRGNEADVAEIDPLVRAELNFIPVSSMDEVLKHALSK
ncbi:MAG: endopeptidase La [Oscillospiraceae bacterium]|nr:endopeptidase La [Oscillospiraceae bacterium]